MDNELFRLCEKVYKRTGWKSDVFINKYTLREKREGKDLFTGDEVPLYTSDYLLEKLPPVVFVCTSDGHNNTAILTLWINGDRTAHVAYIIPFDEQNRGDYAKKADTPLKALLKLVLALHEAGELK